jgi:hypothetical protein
MKMDGKQCRAIIAADRSVMDIAEDMSAAIARLIDIETDRFPNHWTAKEKYEAACHSLGVDQ